MSHDYSQWFSSRNLKKLWNCYCLSMFLRRCIQFDSSDSCQSQCYCLMQHTYQRDAPQPPCCCCMPAAPLCCSSATAVLHKCNWSGYVITGQGCTAAPCLCCSSSCSSSLAWVEEFKLSLSLELVWLGYLGLGTLAWVDPGNIWNIP